VLCTTAAGVARHAAFSLEAMPAACRTPHCCRPPAICARAAIRSSPCNVASSPELGREAGGGDEVSEQERREVGGVICWPGVMSSQMKIMLIHEQPVLHQRYGMLYFSRLRVY